VAGSEHLVLAGRALYHLNHAQSYFLKFFDVVIFWTFGKIVWLQFILQTMLLF
jgi:hypothetical protein